MSISGDSLGTASRIGGRAALLSIPSAVPPPEESGSPEQLADIIIGRGRGVAAAPSWASRVVAALRSLLIRTMALPLGVVIGIFAGTLLAPGTFFLRLAWHKRILLFVFAPFAGILLGVAGGLRWMTQGCLIDLPLVARVLHRWRPILSLPKSLTHHGLGLVIVTRHADVRRVLEREDVFRVDGYDDRMSAASGRFFLGLDGCHTYDQEQALGAHALGRDEKLLRECAGRLSRALVAKAAERPSHTFDIVSELAQVVPLAILKNYFGVPDTPDERLRVWLETMSFFIFNFWVGGPYRAAAVRAGAELQRHLRQLIHERTEALAQGRPITDDVLGRMLRLVKQTSTGPALSPAEEGLVVRTMGGLISGATVPTIGAFVSAIHYLLDLPAEFRQRLRAAARGNDDVTMKRFLLEAVRFSAYPPTLYRHAVQPYVFAPGTAHETTAEEGAWVVTVPLLANFDRSVFQRPASFDPDRADTPGGGPLIVGWSRHRCLGEHMGAMLMVEMAKPLFANDARRLAGHAGRLQKGDPGRIPDADYARHLIVRLAAQR